MEHAGLLHTTRRAISYNVILAAIAKVLVRLKQRWKKMVISNSTSEAAYAVLKKHLTTRQIRLVLDDLAKVPGSVSFRETVSKLIYIHSIQAGKGKEEL
jgi:hypothetical protein